MAMQQGQSSPTSAYIKSVSVRAFKSFGEETQKFTFTKGFNLIVGANGSGKSNILDAIAFALCSKTSALRVRYNTELQSTDTKETCEVILELAVIGNGRQERIITLSVTISPDDSRQYKVDGKLKSMKEVKVRELDCLTSCFKSGSWMLFFDSRSQAVGNLDPAIQICYMLLFFCSVTSSLRTLTQTVIQEILQERRLYIEGTAAIVHQSQVTELADKNSSKLLASIISEASGAGRWNEEVERAQQELKKTRKGLADIQENILLLEKIIEKDQACLKILSRIKQLESEVAFISSQLSAFLFEELLCLRKEIEAKVHLLNSEECRIKDQQLTLDRRKEHIKGLKKQLKLPTGYLESERMHLIDSIAMKEEQKFTYERKLRAAKDAHLRLGHLDKVMQSLEEKISYLNLQIDHKQGFVNRLERENCKSFNASVPLHFYLEDMKDIIIAAEEKLQELHAQQMTVADSLNFLSTSKVSKERQLMEAKQQLALLSDLLHSPNSTDIDRRKKALCNQKLQLKKQEEEYKNRLQTMSAQLGTLSDRESAVPAWPLHSCFTFKKGLQDSSKYFLSLNVISGSLKKTCVTETTTAAADLLRIWEKDGNISRFSRIWPLDRLRVEDRFNQQKIVQQKYPKGSVILPLEHLDYDVKFEKAIKRVFGGYVISSSDGIAKDLILQHRICSVTIDGKVSRFGSVIGGWRDNGKSNYIQSKFENDHFEAKLNSINSTLTSVRRELEELETSLLKFEKIRKEKEDMVQEINNIEDQILELENNLKRKEMELEENQQMTAFLKKDMETNKKQLEEVKVSNHCLEGAEVLSQALKAARDDETALQGILDNTLYRQETIREEKMELQAEVRSIDELNQKVRAYQDELQLLAEQLAKIENQIEDARKEEEEKSSEFSAETEAMESDKIIIAEIQENINMLRNCISKLKLEVKRAEKELESLPQVEVNCSSLQKEDLRDKSDYFNHKRKLESLMEELKKIKPQETRISLDEQIAFNEQIGKLELFKERWMSIAESIDILTEGIENTRSKVQTANEATYQEIQQSFVECCKGFLPNKRVDLIKTGHFVEDGIKFSFCNSKEGSKDASNEWKSNLDELSGGQRTVLSLAFILMVAKCSQSSLYLMDEVDAALDEQNQQSVAKLIKSVIGKDNQVICVSHNITFQQHCDRVIQVSRVDGSTKHIQTHTIINNKLSKKSRIHDY